MQVSIFLLHLGNSRAYFITLCALKHHVCTFTHFLLFDNSAAHHCYIFALCQTLQKKQVILVKAYSMLSSKVAGKYLQCLYSGS